MALTRKFRAAMGIEAEKIDEIISAHTETVDALKNERDTYKNEASKYEADAKKLPGVEKELSDLKEEQSKESPYKEKYEKEHADFEKYKADVTAKDTKLKKENAFRALLKEVGVSEKRIDAVVKVSAIDDLELDSDGKIKDADKKKENIKSEWADFIVTQETHGAKTSNPPAGDGNGNNGVSRAAEVAKKHYAAIYGQKGDSK